MKPKGKSYYQYYDEARDFFGCSASEVSQWLKRYPLIEDTSLAWKVECVMAFVFRRMKRKYRNYSLIKK